jgi:DNA-binding transcriptional LysR family regulator
MPLPEPVPDLAALDLLFTVSELGSISAAGEAHGMSQPAASMRLRALERTLGLQLLERSHTGSRLTPAGTATVAWTGAVLRDVRALLTGTAALRNDEGSRLRVAASLTVAEYLLPGWLTQLGAALPGTNVSLAMGNTARVGDLVAGGGTDVGFIEGPRPPGHVRSRDVTADQLLVVVSPRHAWARRRRPLGPAELSSAPMLLREEGSGTRETLEEALAEHGLVPHALMEIGSTTAIKAAVVAGAGPAVLSALAVRAEVAAGLMVAVPCSGLRLERTIRAIWPSGRPLTGPAARLVQVACTSGP